MNVRACVRFPAKLCVVFIPLLVCGCTLNSPENPASGEVSHADELAIKQAVLKDLFDFQDVRMHPNRPGIWAYAIDDAADGNQLARDFAGHYPPVIASPTIVNDTDESLDKATGKPVEVYAVRIREISCDHARVGAGWRSATLVGIWYSYELQRIKGVWMVRKRDVVGIN